MFSFAGFTLLSWLLLSSMFTTWASSTVTSSQTISSLMLAVISNSPTLASAPVSVGHTMPSICPIIKIKVRIRNKFEGWIFIFDKCIDNCTRGTLVTSVYLWTDLSCFPSAGHSSHCRQDSMNPGTLDLDSGRCSCAAIHAKGAKPLIHRKNEQEKLRWVFC